MSWLFSQVLVEEYSEESFSDGEPFAPLNGTPMPQAFLWRDKTTDAWSRFPSGMMCRPLTASHGEAVLMSFLEAFPAQILVVPERAQASTEKPAGCGDTWPASLAKFDPASSSWRTHQCLLFEDSTECLATLPRWGMMRGGELWERTMPPHLINETESGSWPTPQAHKTTRSGEIVNADGTEWDGLSKPHSKTTGRPITTALADAVAIWPTPQARDWKGSSGRSMKGLEVDLPTKVKMFPTPTVQDSKNNGAPSQMERNTKPLNAEIGGALNPTWVEWLMGWPLGWTDCAASATDRFQQWCDSHGVCSPQQLDTPPQTH
jgi:hypothetical protein